VGYQLAPTLEAVESIQALQMALDSLDGPNGVLKPIHHSDRGVQYCSTDSDSQSYPPNNQLTHIE